MTRKARNNFSKSFTTSLLKLYTTACITHIQSQENQARFIEATATLITYDVNEGMIFLVGDAYLVQGFDSFSGDSLTYDINNDKVLVKGSEDGTKRVKFKIDL